MSDYHELVSKFLEEKNYLTAVTAKTISMYRSAYAAYERTIGTPRLHHSKR